MHALVREDFVLTARARWLESGAFEVPTPAPRLTNDGKLCFSQIERFSPQMWRFERQVSITDNFIETTRSIDMSD